jgi:hypothetical protein
MDNVKLTTETGRDSLIGQKKSRWLKLNQGESRHFETFLLQNSNWHKIRPNKLKPLADNEMQEQSNSSDLACANPVKVCNSDLWKG